MNSIFLYINDELFIGSVLFLAISVFFLFKKIFLGDSLKLTRLTLPSFFLLAYIILLSFPSIVWFLRSAHPIRYTYFLAIQSVLILFPIGVGLADGFFRHPSRIIGNFLSQDLLKTRRDSYIFPFFILMFLFSILIIAVYLLSADYVPLLRAFTQYGEVEEMVVRASIYRVSDITHYALALVLRMFLPFCLLYSYFMAYIYKRGWKFTFWIVLLLTIFASLLTFERIYPFSIFIFLGLAVYFKHYQLISKTSFLLISKSKILISKFKIRLATLVSAILIFAIFVGGIISRTQYNLPLDNIKTIWNVAIKGFLINRVLLDPSYTAYLQFEEFNNPDTFLYGKSIRLLSLFGVEFCPVALAPSFISELWLNFGWLGIIIGTIIVGFILQFIQLLFFRKKSIPILSFYILLLLNGAWIIYGHVLGTMSVSVYLITIFFLFFLLTIKEKRKVESLVFEVSSFGR
jgi:hypothetical protein